jgi:hypothetical protein
MNAGIMNCRYEVSSHDHSLSSKSKIEVLSSVLIECLLRSIDWYPLRLTGSILVSFNVITFPNDYIPVFKLKLRFHQWILYV